MAWNNVTNSTANSGLQQRLADSKGLTTIVPTWFHVKDTEGNLESIASTDYVNYAHQAGLEVWAAIRDFDGGIGWSSLYTIYQRTVCKMQTKWYRTFGG